MTLDMQRGGGSIATSPSLTLTPDRAERSAATAVGAERHKSSADVDVDVAHVAIGHRATRMMVLDQPVDDRALAATGIEVNGQTVTVLRRLAAGGDHCTGSAGRYDRDGAELAFNAIEESTGLRLKARPRRAPRSVVRERARLQALLAGVAALLAILRRTLALRLGGIAGVRLHRVVLCDRRTVGPCRCLVRVRPGFGTGDREGDDTSKGGGDRQKTSAHGYSDFFIV